MPPSFSSPNDVTASAGLLGNRVFFFFLTINNLNDAARESKLMNVDYIV